MVEMIFDSSAQAEPLELKAPYYNAILPTTVRFVRERVAVYADSLGHIEFTDEAGQSLGVVDVPVDKDPSKYGHSAQYGTVKCSADGASVTLTLPVYGWDDSYPYCDGESDRWDRYVARWFRVVYDCGSGEISVLDR